jgi:hypothetical protein
VRPRARSWIHSQTRSTDCCAKTEVGGQRIRELIAPRDAWIPEAHRLLRPGGRLIFLCNSVLMMLCSPPSEEPAGERIVRPQFRLHRIDWPDAEAPNFHLPHGEMLRLLRETSFEVEALHELQAPQGPEDEVRFYLRRGWARRWPGEEVWVARRSPA